MLKELIQLIKWLFSSNPSDCDELQIVQVNYPQAKDLWACHKTFRSLTIG